MNVITTFLSRWGFNLNLSIGLLPIQLHYATPWTKLCMIMYQVVQHPCKVHIRSLHGWPFAGRASNWQSNKLGCYIRIHSPTARSVVLRRRNRTIIDLIGNVFIHNGARSRLSPQMAEPCKERIVVMYQGRHLWKLVKDTKLFMQGANSFQFARIKLDCNCYNYYMVLWKKIILICGCYENQHKNQFCDSCWIYSPV